MALWIRLAAVVVSLLLPGFARAELRVALILPGSDTDKGWNQAAAEGVGLIKKELKAETKVVTSVKSPDFYKQISSFATDGYDLIICHGGEFEKAAGEAAARYPKSKIVVGGCPAEVKGAVTVDFVTRDASELVGYVAGRVTKVKKVAFVGAMKVGPLEACYDGMLAGLKDAGTEATALPALWTNSWESPIKARESTESAMAAGADVIFQNVDAASIGVFQAVQAANKAGKVVYAFGSNSNQNDMAPDVVLGSMVIDIQKAYLDLGKEAAAGRLAAGPRKLGLKGAYVDLVLNEKHPAVTEEIRKGVGELREKLMK